MNGMLWTNEIGKGTLGGTLLTVGFSFHEQDLLGSLIIAILGSIVSYAVSANLASYFKKDKDE